MPALNTPGPQPQTEVQAPLFVGVDVGGTGIKIGVLNDQGQTVAEDKFPTQPSKSPKLAFEQTKRVLDRLLVERNLDWHDVAAVGLGTPGPMDIKNGLILTPVNLSGWQNFPVRDELSKVLGKPVTYANDAGAAAYGEFWVGSGQDYDSLVFITLGTGVGGGIIVNDMSIDGVNSHGAELGHVTIDTSSKTRMCGCGQLGHLEAYASATSFVERTLEALSGESRNLKSSILKDRISEESPLSALMISQAASAGDPLANRMIDETADYLGRGIAIFAHTIDPAAFILGGGMDFGGSDSIQGKKFLNDVANAARKMVFPVVAEKMVVTFAKLGSDAGFIGAAGLARQAYHKK